MKKIIKRGLCVILVIAITIVSFASVVYASEEQATYKSMFQVKYKYDENVADYVKNTPYNTDTIPNNFTVERKDVLGNEKHYLTWDNSGLENSYHYKVEVYCVLYMEYRTIEEDISKPITEMDLENTPWSEYPFIPIQCVDVDASDCGTVINFSDIQATLKNENTFTHDPTEHSSDQKIQLLRLYEKLEEAFDIDLSNLGYDKNLISYNRFYYYMSYIPDCMRYLRFGRVKYFARYVSKFADKELLQPDADGYYHYYFDFVPVNFNPNCSIETVDRKTIIKDRYLKGDYEIHEFKSRQRLCLYVTIDELDFWEKIYNDLTNHDDYLKIGLVGKYSIENKNGHISKEQMNEIDIGNLQNSHGGILINGGNEQRYENDNKEFNINNYLLSVICTNNGVTYEGNAGSVLKISPDVLDLDTNIPIKKYPSIQTSEDNAALSDWLNDGVYSYNTVTVGKFIENDTQIINVKPTPSPTPDTSSSPDVIIVPPSSTTTPKPTPTPSRYPGTGDDYTDTNEDDDNTDMSDVVHWLKMIYNRLGKQLEQFKIINTVVDKLDDIISNQKKLIKGFTDSGTDSENYDVVRYLKKIYNLLLVDKFLDTADELYDYVFDYIAQIGEVFVSTAGSVVDTASKTFPFSVVFIPKLVLDAMSAEPVTPYKKINIKLDEKQVGNVTMPGFDFSFVIDLSQFDSVASMFRQMSVIIFLCGMVKHTVDVVILMKEGVV